MKATTKFNRRKKKKYKTQWYAICSICGRTRGKINVKKFSLCRICLRISIIERKIPGYKKENY